MERVRARKLGLICVAAAAAACALAPAPASAEVVTESWTVPTGTVGPYEVKQAEIPVTGKPPTGAHVLKMETDIVDAESGQPVPISRLMLHHIVFAEVGPDDNTCSEFTGFDSRPGTLGIPVKRFYAAGEERAKLSLPDGYGYPITSGLWGMTYMIMNHRNAPDDALIKYTVTYETDPAGAGLTPVEPWWLDVKDCRADPIYNVPGAKNRKKARKKKAKHVFSRDYTIPAGGRIVGGAGHVHGGAYELNVTQPECGNREITSSLPTWGHPDHPFYTVRPVLHEPGPINMSGFQSETGLPVGPGGKIRLNSVYDNVLPHVRVMGIYLLFVAPPTPGTDSCDLLPGDVETLAPPPGAGRRGKPIPYAIPLTGLDADGDAVTIRKPPGKLKRVKSGADVNVEDRFFDRPNVVLKRGGRLDYRFTGAELHNVTLANGPLGIGSDNLNGSRTFTQKFNRPGTYRLFCGLHPVQMSQQVVVKGKKKKKKKKKRKKRRRG